MKVNSIHLTDFRCHEDTKINLETITFLVGPNASGKTSFREAIEYGLTGKCGVTDDRGSGAQALIKVGASKGEVELDIEGIGAVTRIIPKGIRPQELSVAGWTGGVKAQQQALYEALGASEGVIRAAVNTGRFLSLPPADQKDMLLGLLGIDFPNGLREAVTPELCEADLALGETLGIWRFTGGPEVIDKAYGAVYEARKASKKRLAEQQALANSRTVLPELPPGVTPADRSRVDRELEEVRTQREAVLRELGAAEAAQRRRASLCQAIEKAKAAMADYVPADPGPYKEKLEAARQRQMDSSAQLEELNSRRPGLPASDANADNLGEAIRNLEEDDGSCPLAPGSKCGMNRDQKSQMLADLRAQFDEVLKATREGQKRYEDWASRVKEVNRQLADAGTEVRACEAELWQIVNQESTAKSREAELARLTAELSELGEPRDVDSLQYRAMELKERIARGESFLKALDALQEHERSRLNQAASLNRLEVEVASLEALCELLGPKGFRARLLDQAVAKLQDHAQKRFGLLCGDVYALSFKVDPDFEVWVNREGEEARPAATLSTSEQFRLGIVLQDVLNSLTGLRLMFVDEADQLDPQAKEFLVQFLFQVQPDYDTIIVAATLGEKEPQIEAPGVVMHRLGATGTHV